MLSTLRELHKTLNSKPEFDNVFLEEHKINNERGFPPSYIEYVSTFGWGRLCNLFLVYIPLKKPHPDSWEMRSRYIRNLMDDFYNDIETDDDMCFLLEPDGTLNLVKTAIPFAMSENGEYLIWDIRNPDERGEFPIYVISSRMGGIHYGGKDLLHFVNSCINEVAIQKVMGLGYRKLPPIFEPLEI